MTITSYGYPSTFAPGDVWAELQYALGNRYYVDDPGSAQCTPMVAGTRQVQISTGRLGGWGIADQITAVETLTLPVVASGTKWFLVCARRTWGVVNATTLVVLDPGWTAQPATMPVPGVDDLSWNQDPGVQDDQPLWIVPLRAGQAVPDAPIDVRLIGAGNDFLANSDFVRQYATWAGLRIKIGDTQWRRELNESGTGLVWDSDQSAAIVVSTFTGAGVISTATGWSLVSAAGRYDPASGLAQADIVLKRTGGPLTGSAAGNATDTAVGTLTSALRPTALKPTPGQFAAGSGSSGAWLGAEFTIGTNGVVTLIALAPGEDVNTNNQIRLSFTYVR